MNHEEIPIELRRFGNGFWLRPQLIQFYNCKNITLSDVFITNSPFWCIHLLKSENVICRSLCYDAKLVNNDGIDPECSRNILIENIEFNNGDDNIAIKVDEIMTDGHQLCLLKTLLYVIAVLKVCML